MEKIDIKKDLKHLYQPSPKNISVIEVPAMNFLMIDGSGDPNSSVEFQSAMDALFSVSYTLKFTVKKQTHIDYGVLPVEGLWWTDDMNLFNVEEKENWQWTVMIMQPDFITPSQIEEAILAVQKKKDLPALSNLRFQKYHEGLSAQIMHIGPFSAEGPTVEKLHRYIEDQGYKRTGKHHEIYLSDIRRAAPTRWKTIIRQPVE